MGLGRPVVAVRGVCYHAFSMDELIPNEQPPSGPRLIRFFWACAAYVIAATLILLTNLSPSLVRYLESSRLLAAMLALLSIALVMGLQLWIIYEESALQFSAKAALAVALVLGPLGFLLPLLLSSWVRPATYLMVFSPWRNLLLMVAGVAVGVLVSKALKDAAMLIPTVLVAAVVDFWGVYFGSTLYFVATNPALVEGVSVSVPTVARIFPSSLIGPGDFVFLGVFAASLHRFHLQVNRTFIAFFALLTLSLILLQVAPEEWNLSIPGLVPMALAVLLVNARRVRLSRSEAFATLYAVTAVTALLVLITWLGTFALPRERGTHGPGRRGAAPSSTPSAALTRRPTS